MKDSTPAQNPNRSGDVYRLRRAESPEDAQRLHRLYSEVFHPDEVGVFAETVFHHLPRLEYRHWFIAEQVETGAIVSAFVLIPWIWQMDSVRLKVAEMGIVGTLSTHRGQGLMKALNAEFDTTLKEDSYDLAVIQGIPGFYQQFGYHYAVPLENHINLPLHAVPRTRDEGPFTFRLADQKDIPFLVKDDQVYREEVSLSAVRDEANWRYLLTHSRATEYGSDFWIMEQGDGGQSFYCRIPGKGFGTGLIVSEISQGISSEGLEHLLAFCGQKAVERGKPYIRLNVHEDSRAAQMALALGAKRRGGYAWQIKVPDKLGIVTKLAPVLEARIANSAFRRFSGTLRLDSFKSAIDLFWNEGNLEAVQPAGGDVDDSFAIPTDLFPALCLGHRTWQELRHIRPDVRPSSPRAALLVDVLFPAIRAWIHEQY